MSYGVQDFSSGKSNRNENLFMEVTMVVVFGSIIIWSALVLLGV
jgi:hypothetical protein